MRMPSLFKYFAFVGVALLALLTFINFMLEPSTGATVVAQPKAVTAPQTARPSNMARWQEDAAERKAAEAEYAARVAEAQVPEQAPVKTPAAQAAAPMSAPPAALSTEVTAADEQAARAARRAETKRVKAERARKVRIAHEKVQKAKARELADGRKQDQFFYGQQQAFAPPPPPRQEFGPFGGGWGREW